jgi:hypothetical protein
MKSTLPGAAEGKDSTMLPHFRPLPGDPEPAGQVGIAVATAGLVTDGAARRWPLHGRFRVAISPFITRPQDALRKVVLVLNGSGIQCQARHVVRDELIFPDDVVVQGDQVSASFHVDVLTMFKFVLPVDQYHLFASIGEHLSNTVSVRAAMPWLAQGPGT